MTIQPRYSGHNDLEPMPSRSQAPVFVVGCPRSGTTLLHHMLLSSGDFAVFRSETHAFDVIAFAFGPKLSAAGGKAVLIEKWMRSHWFPLTGLDADYIRGRLESEVRSPGDFLRVIMESVAENQGMRRWADSTPAHLLHMPAIKAAFPDALFVHVIRDGRDVAVSLGHQGWIRPLAGDRSPQWLVAAHYWEWMVSQGRRLGRQLGRDYLEVRYEDLAGEPTSTLQRIGAFLSHDLSYDRILRTPIGSVDRPNSSFAGPDGHFSPLGRWRQLLTKPEQCLLEGAIAPTLAQFGIEVKAPARPSPRQRARRAAYLGYFGLKHALKVQTPLGRRLTSLAVLDKGRLGHR